MPLTHVLRAALLAAPLLLSNLAYAADADADADADAEKPAATTAGTDYQPDPQAGGVLFRQCALCHGQHGQGIIGGKYPRIGGMPEYYLMNALRDYQAGTRGYDAMVVVGGLKAVEETDLMDLAAYASELEVGLRVDGPADGDVKSGKQLYSSDCKTCHGRVGEGKARKESPPLRSQYPEYLLRQIALFKKGEREHAGDPDDETFADYEDTDLRDILAFIATFDDAPGAAGDAAEDEGK